MKLAFMVAAAVSAACGSSAIQAQTTNCSWVGQIWTCHQNGPQAQSDPSIILRAGNLNDLAEANRAYFARQQAQREAQAHANAESYARAEREIADQKAQLAQELRRDVGNRLAAGDCQGALATALQSGDIELANQAKTYCAAPPSK